MKILAKTTGPTLVCTSGEFLDSYKVRLVAYDSQVRGWNNRSLLEITGFVEDEVSSEDLEKLGVDEFVKKFINKKEVKVDQSEEVKVDQPEEVKVEEVKVEEAKAEQS